MLKQQKIFFDFLRFIVGSAKEIPGSLKEADWKELYAIAKKQCLVGILFDGIKKLPAEYVGIEKELLLQWMAESQMLEKENVRLHDAAINVSEWFRKKGFRTCILKGQGNALMYPNPYSRNPGDIDIWVEGRDKRVISFVRSISPHEKACYHHIEFPLTHIYAHLMNEGIGLRQLLDYYYVLISDDLSLIRDRVQKELKELGV